MSTEIAVPEDDVRTLVVPGTGELVRIETPDEAVAALDRLDDLAAAFAAAKRHVTDRLTELAKLHGKRTLEVAGGRKVTLSSGTTTSYDADEIYAELIDAGMPESRIEEIIETTVTHRVRAVEAKRAAAANPEYDAIISKHTKVHEKPVYASVSRR